MAAQVMCSLCASHAAHCCASTAHCISCCSAGDVQLWWAHPAAHVHGNTPWRQDPHLRILTWVSLLPDAWATRLPFMTPHSQCLALQVSIAGPFLRIPDACGCFLACCAADFKPISGSPPLPPLFPGYSLLSSASMLLSGPASKAVLAVAPSTSSTAAFPPLATAVAVGKAQDGPAWKAATTAAAAAATSTSQAATKPVQPANAQPGASAGTSTGASSSSGFSYAAAASHQLPAQSAAAQPQQQQPGGSAAAGVAASTSKAALAADLLKNLYLGPEGARDGDEEWDTDGTEEGLWGKPAGSSPRDFGQSAKALAVASVWRWGGSSSEITSTVRGHALQHALCSSHACTYNACP